MDSAHGANTEGKNQQQHGAALTKRLDAYKKAADEMKGPAGRCAQETVMKLQVIFSEHRLAMELEFSDLEKIKVKQDAIIAELQMLSPECEADQLPQRIDVERIKDKMWGVLTEGLSAPLAELEAVLGITPATGTSDVDKVSELDGDIDGAQVGPLVTGMKHPEEGAGQATAKRQDQPHVSKPPHTAETAIRKKADAEHSE